ncbi:hypothetical protein KEH51_17030 [[Brevibacterium] frigoritolerans]|uniref:Uncharacterized protein n=1 Tax=Peribacillus frigoritolerans TaxID=450367 RepID=A0A941J748_9BACI|nr:hypothetical protein [Peribacillus frigoritolerans]
MIIATANLSFNNILMSIAAMAPGKCIPNSSFQGLGLPNADRFHGSH